MPSSLLLSLVLVAGAVAPDGDARCALVGPRRAAAFAVKGQTPMQRYDALVKACALPEVTTLATRLISFKTVTQDETPASTGTEATAMAAFLKEWAREHGLNWRVVGKNDVMEVSLGEGAPLLGFVTHGDVVPVTPSQWKHNPFDGVVEGGRLHGRGSEDDKGPLASALVAVAMAKEMGLKPRGRVLVLVGMGEEGNWEGMKAYATKEPRPTHVVSLDAGFPVVFAQFGFVVWGLEAPLGITSHDEKPVMVDVKAGEFLTQVPGEATLTLAPSARGSADDLERLVRSRVKALSTVRREFSAEVTRDGTRVVVATHGKAVHSSTADEGHNALWELAALGHVLPVAPNGISAMLDVVATRFDGDHWGENLGVAYRDDMMGPLMVAPTLLSVKDGKVLLGVNMRRPRGLSASDFKARLHAASEEIARDLGAGLKERGELYVGDPHVADSSGTLVDTLMDIYRRRHGPADAKPVAIRGGTYARLFPGAVDFGPAFPGDPYLGHGVDESIALDTLDQLTGMVAEVLFTLAITR